MIKWGKHIKQKHFLQSFETSFDIFPLTSICFTNDDCKRSSLDGHDTRTNIQREGSAANPQQRKPLKILLSQNGWISSSKKRYQNDKKYSNKILWIPWKKNLTDIDILCSTMTCCYDKTIFNSLHGNNWWTVTCWSLFARQTT